MMNLLERMFRTARMANICVLLPVCGFFGRRDVARLTDSNDPGGHIPSPVRGETNLAQREAFEHATAAVWSLNQIRRALVFQRVGTFLVWCILLVLCWPLALFGLVVYPLVWILLIPFRIVGIAVDGVLGVVRGVVMLPVRLLRGPQAL